MLSARFNLVAGLVLLVASAAGLMLIQGGFKADQKILFPLVFFALLLFLPRLAAFDEEESLFLNKCAYFALIVFAVGSLLVSPALLTLAFSLLTAATGISGYYLVLREEQKLEREICSPIMEGFRR